MYYLLHTAARPSSLFNYTFKFYEYLRNFDLKISQNNKSQNISASVLFKSMYKPYQRYDDVRQNPIGLCYIVLVLKLTFKTKKVQNIYYIMVSNYDFKSLQLFGISRKGKRETFFPINLLVSVIGRTFGSRSKETAPPLLQDYRSPQRFKTVSIISRHSIVIRYPHTHIHGKKKK